MSAKWLCDQNRRESADQTGDYGVYWLASEAQEKQRAELRRRVQVWIETERRA